MKRVLTDFELSKIAAVPKPAQEGALAVILKSAPSSALTFDEALVLLTKAKQQTNDPDDDGSIDDWSPKDQSRRRKKPPRAWDRSSIDEVERNEMNKAKLVEHPFIEGARQLAQQKGIRLYEAIAQHRRNNPRSWRHFYQMQQTQPVPKQMKKSVAPDDAVVAWDAAVNTFVDQGLSRTQAMTEIRKRAPNLYRRYRR
jgi:hypothetical protein